LSDDYKPVLRPGSDPLVFFGRAAAEAGSGIAKGHVMAAAMSRALRDGEVAVVGANSMLPVAAARLAQLTHAPNLSLIAGASGGVNPLLDPLTPSSGDYANLVAEAALSFTDVLTLWMGGKTDVFFAGGIQVDRRGNTNLAFIGPPDRPTFRGPGSAGTPWANSCRRTILYNTSHTRRLFVPEVDFVSLAGWIEDAPADHRGPELVVTPLSIMDFDEHGNMRLVSVHEGVTADDVVANTGFDLILPGGDVPTTPPPTPRELQLMREFDLDGLLAIVI
jgi:glutaconate CoA-transferase, subunit B